MCYLVRETDEKINGVEITMMEDRGVTPLQFRNGQGKTHGAQVPLAES